MGTRSLIIVHMDGEYRVAQYSQFDGYPEGQGRVFLKFLQEEFVEYKFRLNLRRLKTVRTQEERDALAVLYREELHGKYCAEFDRETGAKILKLIQNGEVSSGFLVSDIGFASHGDCEYVWVLDLDNRTFEAYEGWNKTPLTESDRFYFLGNYKDGDYCGAKCVHQWPLSDLPTVDEFIQAFATDEDE